MRILVTGAAGFIGYHLCNRLLDRGDEVVGVDNFIPIPYDTPIKTDRWAKLKDQDNFISAEGNVLVPGSVTLTDLLSGVDVVCHLAATAGVRKSIEVPDQYIQTNIVCTANLLEACKDKQLDNFVFASSSSVYGESDGAICSEHSCADRPVSLYAATKRSCELIAHSYNKIYDMKITGLRFFTVYGPWGRPDMALYKFVMNIFENKPIDVFNKGELKRDFTYIDDIVDGIILCLDNPVDFEIFNIGCGSPQNLMDFIRVIEQACHKTTKLNLLPMQRGDVKSTFADISKIKSIHGYEPKITIDKGIPRTVRWMQEYYGL